MAASFSDDYVASILQRDADKKSTSNLSSLFSSVGSVGGGGRGGRTRSAAPKPNARFLKNLVRDVDSHNAALKEKEERESRRRMWDLQRGKKGERPERGRKEVNDDGGKEGSKRRRSSLERYAPGSRRHEKARDEAPGRERKHHHRSEKRRREERETSRSRSRSPARERTHRHRPRHRRDPKGTDDRESPDQSHRPSEQRQHRGAEAEEESSSSEGEIGPELPARGRGSQHTSILDQKEEVKMPRPTVDAEEDIANVKWTSMGQEREWDRGKDKDPFNMKSAFVNSEDWTGRLR
jgi:phage-related minor tail protein